MATGWARRRQAADWVLGRCECGGVRGCAVGEIVFGGGIRVRTGKCGGLGGVSGVGAKAVSEMWLGQCCQIAKVIAVG